MATKKRLRKGRFPTRRPIPLKKKPERRAVFYHRVARVDEPIDVKNNKVRNTPIIPEFNQLRRGSEQHNIIRNGHRKIVDEHKGLRNNTTPTNSGYLFA
jgi:hypothetical protein